jgi:ATP-dependent Clp protease ATP-binding subunit ClpA
MMFERFTKPARAVVIEAQVAARELGHDEVRAEHLLVGLMRDPGVGGRVLSDLGLTEEALTTELASLGPADADALRSIGVDLAAVRGKVEAAFGDGALDRRGGRRRGFLRRRGPATGGHLPFTAAAKKALEQSLRAALSLKHGYIGTEHILLGLVAEDSGPAARTLARLGIAPTDVRAGVRDELRRSA